MKKMKSLAFLLTATLSLATVFAVSPSPTQAAETGTGPTIHISLSSNQLYLPVGGAQSQLSAITTPVVPNLPFTWKSENPTIASVNPGGFVTPVGVGTTNVDLITPQGQVVLSCAVTVYPTVTSTPKPIPTPALVEDSKTTLSTVKVKSVTLDSKDKTVSIGQTFKLTPTLSPANSSNPGVKWTISDPSVLSWKDGVGFTALKAGKAAVTVTTAGGGYTATSSITVAPAVAPTPVPTQTPAKSDAGKTTTATIKVKSVTLDAKDKTVSLGQTFKLTPTLSPVNSSNPSVKWTISDPSVLSWKGGVGFTALKAGKAVVTATTVDGGHTATCSVTIAPNSTTKR